jgi:hypothetical protein
MIQTLTLRRLAIAFTLAIASAVSATTSPTSQVKQIVQMGGRWGNGNAGGFYFYLVNMPADIEYFIVRPTDVGVKAFLTQCELSLSVGRPITVEYDKTNFVAGTKYEGDLRAITIQ